MATKNGSPWSDAGEVPAPARKGLSQSQQPALKGESVPREKDGAVDGAAMEHDAGMKPQPPAKSLTREAPRPGMIERSLQAQLGRQLQVIFSDVAEEPVPDRFVKLLEELEAREKRR
jgi:hypothetical protein